MANAPPKNVESMLEGVSVNPRKRARSTFRSPPPAAVEKLEVEWPHFLLDRKHHRNVDISWGMRLYPDDLDNRSTTDVAGSDSKYTDEHIPDKAVADMKVRTRIEDQGGEADQVR